jgi:hypothetical protein
MNRELKGWARPRPIRIAFLVEDSRYAAATLDAIFADCYGRWGGRFSLIVPCVGGRISPSYWPWLEAYDPDLIYSYVPLDRDNILDLHERLYLAKYTLHRLYRDRFDESSSYRPSYDFEVLSSLSTIFRLARYTRVRGDGAAVQIIDSWFTERPSRFLTDNFGTYFTSRGSGVFPPDAMGAASLLTIVAPENQADPRRGVPRDLNAIPNEMAAFSAFAERRSTSLSMASQIFAPKLDIEAGQWSGTFNLVVGENFADRLMFWNARLLIPSWLDDNLCCFRVTAEQVEDGDFLTTLVTLINQYNHVNAGAGGQPQLTIRSCSLDVPRLSLLQERITAHRPWSVLRTEVVPDLGAIVPAEHAFATARESSRFGHGLFPRADWAEFTWTEPTARPPTAVPDHLVDAPPRQFFTTGYWGTDYLLENGGPAPRFADSNRWILGRRWRMARAFQVRRTDEPRHAIPPPPRRSRGGALAVFNSADYQVDTITVPTALEAFAYALTEDGRWAAHAERAEQIEPHSRASRIHASNEARYFVGVLGMAGGLAQASGFLLHPFMRKVFGSLGGTPALQPDKVTPTVNRLRKLVPRIPTFDLRAEREREVLGTLIVKAAQTLKSPRMFVRYEELKAAWKNHRAAYWDAHPQQVEGDPDVDWDELEDRSLDQALISMRRRQIVFQGHQWTCWNCHHRNWVDLSDLASEFACEVCKTIVQAPVAIDWLFRPNEFLIDSLRDHSVLSLLWTLYVLLDRSRTSFFYAEPAWLWFESDTNDPEAEADLLVLSDGRAILCEIKNSWHSLRLSDVRNLVNLARRLRPDLALLAVMETGEGPQAELRVAKSELEAVGIAFELLTPSGEDYLDDPYLPAAEE